MKMKPALLALAAAAITMAGCEQRSATDTTNRSAATTMPPSSATTPQASTSSDKMASTDAMKPNSAADAIGNAASDAAITAKVKAAILAEPGLKSLAINVDTKDATVTLSGSVASDSLRDRAKQIAMSTEGVRNVVDNLNVKSS